MNRIGTDGGLAETLESFLCRQIAGLEVPESSGSCFTIWWAVWRTAEYLTVPAEELAVGAGVPEELRRSIARLRRWSRRGWGLRI